MDGMQSFENIAEAQKWAPSKIEHMVPKPVPGFLHPAGRS
jgi:hypothetical protein